MKQKLEFHIITNTYLDVVDLDTDSCYNVNDFDVALGCLSSSDSYLGIKQTLMFDPYHYNIDEKASR